MRIRDTTLLLWFTLKSTQETEFSCTPPAARLTVHLPEPTPLVLCVTLWLSFLFLCCGELLCDICVLAPFLLPCFIICVIHLELFNVFLLKGAVRGAGLFPDCALIEILCSFRPGQQLWGTEAFTKYSNCVKKLYSCIAVCVHAAPAEYASVVYP